MFMCSKAEWFRDRNSADRGVAAPFPSSCLLLARVGNAELDRYPQVMLLGKKYTSRTSIALFNVSNTTLCRQRSVWWITSLSGGISRWGPNQLVGRSPRHTAPPSPQTARKWWATVSAPLRINYFVRP